MEYKDTLFMKESKYEMRGNLNKKDPIFINEWDSNGLYDKLSNRDGEEFILHDGPPYANGDIHIGHALNKILKDFIIRDQALNGKRIDWRAGWDTHGLPIELKVQQSGIKLSEVGKEEYLKACYKYAYEQVEKQEAQFKKLALLTDFDQKYLTLNRDFEARQISVFNKMLNKGLVYQDLKPVYWSWSSETALAEAEIEYKEVKDISLYVKFKIKDEDVSFLIWTTTPWTLPANVAIAFGEKIQYALVEVNNEKIILAKNLIENLQIEWESKIEFVEDVDVSKYIGTELINPVNERKSIVVWGHHVTTEGGTGIVHIAGGHGMDDYIITKDNNLPLIVVQDDKGHMMNAGEYDGIFYMKANKLIANKLLEDKTAIFSKMIEHSVAIDWRTKEPVVYRATKQWFVSINPIKDDLIKEIRNVDWIPGWGEERLIKMTENRDDWCISRQRSWGVPIPVIYDENRKPIIDEALQTNIINAFEEEGIIAWDKKSIKDLLPPHIEYNEKMKKETDILDVWFDSGTSFELLEGKTADIYLEGNDQYRGWFNSSLINSFISNGKSPYKKVITHGMVVDGKGNKMSKSIGNTISPMEITDKYGADILRLWASTSDYQDNVKISDDVLKQVTSDYRTIRNTLKFLTTYYEEFETVPDLSEIDKTVLNELSIIFDKIKEGYKNFNYINVTKEIINAVSSNGIIGWFNNYSKDIIYTHNPEWHSRKSTLYVVNKITNFILYSMAPIMPVTIEEAWKVLGNDSIYETTYPTFDKYESKPFNSIIKIKDVIYKEYETLRKEDKELTSTEQLEVNLTVPAELNIWGEELARLMLVSNITVSEGEINAVVKNKNGKKCLRCWKYFNENNMDGEICLKCKEAIK